MTQDEIIEQELKEYLDGAYAKYSDAKSQLEAFAKLVDAKATAREREACAKVCEGLNLYGGAEYRQLQRATLKDCAYAIRARGEA